MGKDSAGRREGGAAADHESMPGMPGMGTRYAGEGAWIFIAGLSAAKLGDANEADQARAKLSAMRKSVESGGDAYAAKPFAIMENEVASAAQLARGQKAEAVRLAKEAADIESTLAAPSGPPEPIKPALEFYGEVLVGRGTAGGSCRGVPAGIAPNSQANAIGGRARASHWQKRWRRDRREKVVEPCEGSCCYSPSPRWHSARIHSPLTAVRRFAR